MTEWLTCETQFAGPEYSIQLIFRKARQYAPCYLVFEDLDSIVSDGVRSYFLNEVDGLQSNDGIFMIGSTNHLDRLDPGIAASLTPSISKPPGALLRSATIVAQVPGVYAKP